MALKEAIPISDNIKSPVSTTLCDFFKIGPGPSSSHTIGPMKAGYNFIELCGTLPENILRAASGLHVTLYGSLSATGKGHATDVAVLAGLLGNSPETCAPSLLQQLRMEPEKIHMCVIVSASAGGQKRLPIRLADVEFGPVQHKFPYSNTLICSLRDSAGTVLFEREYYSVGGGFLQWKDWKAPERGKPRYPYSSMKELRGALNTSGLALHELMLENETAISGTARPQISEYLDMIIERMDSAVKQGLAASGPLPGWLGVSRKARQLLENAEKAPFPSDILMGKINAYAFAVSEENASGGVIVTAPTCGAAGVMPALLYAMRHDLHIGERVLREGILAAAAVGFLAKHNAGIAGAEVGCQGEVGVASSMAAAMAAHARGYGVTVVENAAEIALEHHLGMTCDPVGGFVQIPCIERNAVGAIKAYNAMLLAISEPAGQHLVSLDAAIHAMGETGREMLCKYKETSEGGLAVSFVEC